MELSPFVYIYNVSFRKHFDVMEINCVLSESCCTTVQIRMWMIRKLHGMQTQGTKNANEQPPVKLSARWRQETAPWPLWVKRTSHTRASRDCGSSGVTAAVSRGLAAG